MRFLRTVWNILFLAAGARLGYLLYTDPAARAATRDWFIWLANGGLFREGNAAEIVQELVVLLAIVAFFDAIRSTVTSLARWFIQTTPQFRCTSCDRIVLPTDKFCANCGFPLRGTAPEPGHTVPTAKSIPQAPRATVTRIDVSNKSRSSMVGVAVMLLLLSMFAFFWFLGRHAQPTL